MRRTTITILLFLALVPMTTPVHAQLLDAVALDSVRTYRSIERALKEPDQVFKLDLSGQKLKELPEELFLLKNLNALDLSNNKLKVLPERFGELVHMQDLRLSRNKLLDFPGSICRMTHMKRLDMSRNALVGLPPCIGALTELTSLDLWDNDLGEFPEELEHMTSLRFLDLRAIQFEQPEMEHIQNLLPKTKIYFSQPCNCGM
jgi:Leucine-rich repeat (LRR) protein